MSVMGMTARLIQIGFLSAVLAVLSPFARLALAESYLAGQAARSDGDLRLTHLITDAGGVALGIEHGDAGEADGVLLDRGRPLHAALRAGWRRQAARGEPGAPRREGAAAHPRGPASGRVLLRLEVAEWEASKFPGAWETATSRRRIAATLMWLRLMPV